MAKTHYVHKHYDRAIREIAPFIEQFDQQGKGAQARCLLALSYLAELEYERSIQTSREVLSKYSSDELAPTSQQIIACAYLAQRKYQEAEKEFQRLIDDYPRSRWIWEAKRYIEALRDATAD